MKKRNGLIMTAMSFLFLALSAGCGDQREEEYIEAAAHKPLVNIAHGLPKGGVAVVNDEIARALEGVEDEGEAGSKTATVQPSEEPLPPLKGRVRVAVVGQPNERILETAAPLLRQRGYELEAISCEDYDSPNALLLEGRAEANFFQHSAYLQRYNQNKDTNLTSLGAVHYEPMAIYPGTCKTLEDLEKGATIGVPKGPTGYAQALLLLQQEGLLKLMEDTDLTAVWEDVVENPLELKLAPMDEEELVSSLDRLDLAIFHGGYGLWKGISPSAALAREEDTSLAAGMLSQILVTAGSEEAEQSGTDEAEAMAGQPEAPEAEAQAPAEAQASAESSLEEGLAALMEVLKSEEMKEYINRQYQGSIVVLE